MADSRPHLSDVGNSCAHLNGRSQLGKGALSSLSVFMRNSRVWKMLRFLHVLLSCLHPHILMTCLLGYPGPHCLPFTLQELCRDKHADVQEGLVNFFPALLAKLPCQSRASFFQTLTQSLSLECATWRCRIGLATQLGSLASLEV